MSLNTQNWLSPKLKKYISQLALVTHIDHARASIALSDLYVLQKSSALLFFTYLSVVDTFCVKVNISDLWERMFRANCVFPCHIVVTFEFFKSYITYKLSLECSYVFQWSPLLCLPLCVLMTHFLFFIIFLGMLRSLSKEKRCTILFRHLNFFRLVLVVYLVEISWVFGALGSNRRWIRSYLRSTTKEKSILFGSLPIDFSLVLAFLHLYIGLIEAYSLT